MKIKKMDIVWVICALCFFGVFSAIATLRISVAMPFLSTIGLRNDGYGGYALARGAVLFVLQMLSRRFCVHSATGIALFVCGLAFSGKSEKTALVMHRILCLWNLLPSVVIFSNSTIRTATLESLDVLAIFCLVFALACFVFNFVRLTSESAPENTGYVESDVGDDDDNDDTDDGSDIDGSVDDEADDDSDMYDDDGETGNNSDGNDPDNDGDGYSDGVGTDEDSDGYQEENPSV